MFNLYILVSVWLNCLMFDDTLGELYYMVHVYVSVLRREKGEACTCWEGSYKTQFFGHHLHSVALKEALCKHKSISTSFW